MKLIIFLISMFLIGFSAKNVEAMDCRNTMNMNDEIDIEAFDKNKDQNAILVFDEEKIENTQLIFEGRALEIVSESESTSGEARIEYNFLVLKLWKGDIEEENVVITRDSQWGDVFEIGKDYFIEANGYEGQYDAAVCSNTTSLGDAADKIKILKEFYDPKKKNQ